MDLRKVMYVCTLFLSLLAILAGIVNRQADLLMPGMLSTLLSAIMLIMSFRGRSMRIDVPMILNFFLIVAITSSDWDLDGFARLILATPLFVALGTTIVCCLIAYGGVRLDRVMFYVYMLFSTLAVSNIFSYGVYYYYIRYGIADEMQANFWLVDEFAFALTFCVLGMFILRTYMRKKDIRLIDSGILLGGYDGGTE